MSAWLSNLLIVLGLCAGALGASGFDKPSDPEAPEPAASTQRLAWPLFLGGLVFMAVGAVGARRKGRGGEGAAEQQGQRADVLARIERIRDEVIDLDEHKAELGAEDLRRRIDELMLGDYFDLTSANEELAALLGFTDYARVWDGIATAERMLSRCWSMTTDGYREQGIEELPYARENLVRAAEVMASL